MTVEPDLVAAVTRAGLVASLEPLRATLDELHPVCVRSRRRRRADVIHPDSELSGCSDAAVLVAESASTSNAGCACRNLRGLVNQDAALVVLLRGLELDASRYRVAGEDLALRADCRERLVGGVAFGLTGLGDVGTRAGTLCHVDTVTRRHRRFGLCGRGSEQADEERHEAHHDDELRDGSLETTEHCDPSFGIRW